MDSGKKSYTELVQRINPVAKVAEWHKVFHVKPIYTPLRADLIAEEVEEFCQATSDIERLDALCDIMYVVAGTLVCNGAEYVPQGTLTPKNLEQVGDCYLLKTLSEAFAANDDRSHELCVLLELCAMIAQHYGFDLARNFDIVHENNMQKMWTQEQVEALPEDCTYSVTLSSRSLDGWKFIVKSPAGKVLKPPGHQKPQLILEGKD